MTTFLQFHTFTSYPAANLNRDDTGRPKTLMYGGATRLRVSSQSIKRAWRTSKVFHDKIGDALGTRSIHFAEDLLNAVMAKGVDESTAIARVKKVLEDPKVGKLKKRDAKKDPPSVEILTEQLVHLGKPELDALMALADDLAAGDPDDNVFLPKKEQIAHGAPDIALFGRMLADRTDMKVEAACQVAHAFTTHRVTVEDDFYTAVDDLKDTAAGDDAGAGFLGVHDYGAGVFYQYVNLSADALIENLAGDTALAQRTVEALVEAMATVSPTGKQNSYASRARASYCLLEVGSAAPRSFAEAFLKPIWPKAGDDLLALSIDSLQDQRARFGKVYGDNPETTAVFNVVTGEGTVANVIKVAAEAIAQAAP